jgi:hypothetical protein
MTLIDERQNRIGPRCLTAIISLCTRPRLWNDVVYNKLRVVHGAPGACVNADRRVNASVYERVSYRRRIYRHFAIPPNDIIAGDWIPLSVRRKVTRHTYADIWRIEGRRRRHGTPNSMMRKCEK